jgi:hypothetical protein
MTLCVAKLLLLGCNGGHRKRETCGTAANFRGRILNRYPIQFDNSGEGFQQLLGFIKRSQKQYAMDDVIVGIESTDHYFFNLANCIGSTSAGSLQCPRILVAMARRVFVVLQ